MSSLRQAVNLSKQLSTDERDRGRGKEESEDSDVEEVDKPMNSNSIAIAKRQKKMKEQPQPKAFNSSALVSDVDVNALVSVEPHVDDRGYFSSALTFRSGKSLKVYAGMRPADEVDAHTRGRCTYMYTDEVTDALSAAAMRLFMNSNMNANAKRHSPHCNDCYFNSGIHQCSDCTRSACTMCFKLISAKLDNDGTIVGSIVTPSNSKSKKRAHSQSQSQLQVTMSCGGAKARYWSTVPTPISFRWYYALNGKGEKKNEDAIRSQFDRLMQRAPPFFNMKGTLTRLGAEHKAIATLTEDLRSDAALNLDTLFLSYFLHAGPTDAFVFDQKLIFGSGALPEPKVFLTKVMSAVGDFQTANSKADVVLVLFVCRVHASIIETIFMDTRHYLRREISIVFFEELADWSVSLAVVEQFAGLCATRGALAGDGRGRVSIADVFHMTFSYAIKSINGARFCTFDPAKSSLEMSARVTQQIMMDAARKLTSAHVKDDGPTRLFPNECHECLKSLKEEIVNVKRQYVCGRDIKQTLGDFESILVKANAAYVNYRNEVERKNESNSKLFIKRLDSIRGVVHELKTKNNCKLSDEDSNAVDDLLRRYPKYATRL